MYFGTGVIWWYLLIVVELFSIVVTKRVRTTKMEGVIYHIIGFGFPAIHCVFPYVGGYVNGKHEIEYAPDGLWCFLSRNHKG